MTPVTHQSAPTSMTPSLTSLFGSLVGNLMVIVWLTGTPQNKLLGSEILNLHTFHIQLQLPGIRMWIFPGNHYSVHILDTENRTSADKGSEPFAWSQFLHLSIVRDRKLQEPQSPHWGQPVVPRAILEAVGNGVRPQEDDFAVGDTCSLHSHC